MRNARRFDRHVTVGCVPSDEDLRQLRDLGYRTIVDVRELEERFGGRIEQVVQELEMTYVDVPISRAELKLDDVVDFYEVVLDEVRAPLYVFSRFGKKPLAFLVLIEALANGEPLQAVFQRAGRYGLDLRGDLCLQAFLVNLYNAGHTGRLLSVVCELRPELAKPSGAARERRAVVHPLRPVSLVHREDRERLLGQRGCTIWLTGLPVAGKSTIAFALEKELIKRGRLTKVLDSAEVRCGLSANLGFSEEERSEHVRRLGQLASSLADLGAVVIVAAVSPRREGRAYARTLHRDAGLNFVEVFVDTPQSLCEQRDFQGLYRLARDGALPNFPGLEGHYQRPEEPDLVVTPAEKTPFESSLQIMDGLSQRGLLRLEPSV